MIQQQALLHKNLSRQIMLPSYPQYRRTAPNYSDGETRISTGMGLQFQVVEPSPRKLSQHRRPSFQRVQIARESPAPSKPIRPPGGTIRPHFGTSNSMAVEVLVLDLSVLLLFIPFPPGPQHGVIHLSICIMRIEGHTMNSYISESASIPDSYDCNYNTLSQVITNQQYHTYRLTMSNESQHDCRVVAAPNTFNHENYMQWANYSYSCSRIRELAEGTGQIPMSQGPNWIDLNGIGSVRDFRMAVKRIPASNAINCMILYRDGTVWKKYAF